MSVIFYNNKKRRKTLELTQKSRLLQFTRKPAFGLNAFQAGSQTDC